MEEEKGAALAAGDLSEEIEIDLWSVVINLFNLILLFKHNTSQLNKKSKLRVIDKPKIFFICQETDFPIEVI